MRGLLVFRSDYYAVLAWSVRGGCVKRGATEHANAERWSEWTVKVRSSSPIAAMASVDLGDLRVGRKGRLAEKGRLAGGCQCSASKAPIILGATWHYGPDDWNQPKEPLPRYDVVLS